MSDTVVRDSSDRLFWIITALAMGVAGGVVAFFACIPAPTTTGASSGAGLRPPAAEAKRRGKQTSRFHPWAQIRRKQVFTTVQGDAAFKRLLEPDPGDWLYSFREPGQTLNEYARSRPVRKTSGRKTLHLLPFTDLDATQREMLEPVRAHTALFFDTRVATLPTQKPNQRWYNTRRQQYNADTIVRHLAGKVPPDSLGLFGLMGSDLYGLGLNFVFGEALLADRAGIYSLARYGKESKPLLRRSLKLSAHEIGHMFGLKHCVFYECVMNGVNSRSELDRSPLHLCPVCLAKLKWNLKFDVVRRYRKLGRYYRRLGLESEGRFVEQRATELGL